MLRNKKIVALLLCLVILSQGVNVMAVSFSDVKQSGDSGWAYEYIIDLANKGIINGYDDGTYKPKSNVSILETISLLYGVMDPSQSEVNAALAKHKDYIKTKLSDVNWGQERLAYAIEKGVVTKTDLEDAHKAGMLKNGTKIYASRYSVAIMTARALGLEAKTSYNLTYKDLDKINKDSRGLIAALIDTEVLHKDGIDGNFAPNESITRAQMAKMISIAYNWKNKNAKNLETKTESGKVVEVLDFDDYKSLVYTKEYANANTSAKVDKNTKITDKDGKTVEYKNLNNYKGAKATITFTGSHPDKKATEVKFTSDASYADGVFTFVSFRTDGKKNYIKLKDSKGNALDEVQCLYDFAKDGSNQVKISSLPFGTELDIEFVAGVVSDVKLHRGKTGEYKIESIDTRFGRVTLSWKNSRGYTDKKDYTFNSNVNVQDQNGKWFNVNDLRVGDMVDITTGSYLNTITKFVVYTNLNSGDYNVESYDATTLKVTDNYRRSYEYQTAYRFTFNGREYTSLYGTGLKQNDKVNIKFDGSRIVEITTANYSSNREQVSLTVGWNGQIEIRRATSLDQTIDRSSRVNLYINGTSVSYNTFAEAVRNSNVYNYSAEATFVNGNIDSIYLTTNNYNYYNNRGTVTNIDDSKAYYQSGYQTITVYVNREYKTIKIYSYDKLYRELKYNDEVYVSFNNYGEISFIEKY